MNPPRVGVALIDKRHASTVVETIRLAEQRGVPCIWTDVSLPTPDPLTILGAVAVTTATIQIGVGIVPTYPRHPAILANQMQALHQLMPGRVRMGIGPSHRHVVSGAYGMDMGKPLAHLREYLIVLRGLTERGLVDFDGDYYNVHVELDSPAPMPLYISALRLNAFRLAGELADGAIAWLCPLDYLVDQAIPAMRETANTAGRPVPRVVAEFPTVMTSDRDTMRRVALPPIERYLNIPYYGRMFEAAGHQLSPEGNLDPALLDDLVLWGDPDTIRRRIQAILDAGIDEVVLDITPVNDAEREMEQLSVLLASFA